MRDRLNSFRYAFRGIAFAVRSARNQWIQLAIGTAAVALGLWLGLSASEWAVVALCCGTVLAAETFNSAVEELVDLVQPDHDPRAGRIKDMAAGAVLWTSLGAAAAGLVIFLPKLLAMG